jgi:hypothetical protein
MYLRYKHRYIRKNQGVTTTGDADDDIVLHLYTDAVPGSCKVGEKVLVYEPHTVSLALRKFSNSDVGGEIFQNPPVAVYATHFTCRNFR